MIESETIRHSYVASAGQTDFTYTFYLLDEDYVAVYKNGTLQTIDTHYTVEGVGVEAGGKVIFNTGVALNDVIELILNPTFDQLTNYIYGGKFPEEAHEAALDKLTQMCLVLRGEIADLEGSKGVATVGSGVEFVDITFASAKATADYVVQLTPHWMANGAWPTNLTTTGFRANFASPPGAVSKLSWSAR